MHKSDEDLKFSFSLIGGLVFLGVFIYLGHIRPEGIKLKCRDQAYTETRQHFAEVVPKTNDEIELQNWYLSVRYNNCIANHQL